MPLFVQFLCFTYSASAGLHAAPVEKALKKGGVEAIAPCKDCDGDQVRSDKLLGGFFICFPRQPIAERVMGGEEAEDPAAAEAGSDIDLLEDEDEAIGDRIMEVGAPAQAF